LQPARSKIMVVSGDCPTAPPGANKLQLELWRRILLHRREQIQTLSPSNFRLYVAVIALDLKPSRSKKVCCGDLAKGPNSSYLICEHPPPSSVTAPDVAHHILALFYHSIDERLSSDARKYALNAVKRSFLSLDKTLEDQALNSDIAQIENQARNSNDNNGSKIRTVLQANTDSTSTQESDLLGPRSGRTPDPSINEEEVRKKHYTNTDNVRKNLSHTLHAKSAMVTQAHQSSNNQGFQKSFNSDREGTEKRPSSKRSGYPLIVRDVPNVCNNEHVDQNNNDDEGEEPKNKRNRTEVAPILDANNASKQLSQHRDIQAKQNAHRKQTEEGEEKESNRNRQQNEAPSTANANNAQEEKIHYDGDNEPVIVVVNTALSDSIFGSKKNQRAATSSSKEKRGTASQSPSTIKETSTSNEKRVNSSVISSCFGSTLGSQPSHAKAALPPTAFPPPIPFVCVRSITFLHDNQYPGPASASLQPRDTCTVSYDAGFNLAGSGSCLDDKTFSDVRERLERWEPYWRIVKELGHQEVLAAGGRGNTKTSTRTTPCVSAFNLSNNDVTNFPMSCAMVTVDLPRECINANISNSDASLRTWNNNPWGLRWGELITTYRTGDRRLLLRMLPLMLGEKEKKRSDTHLWPIGTFLQLSRGTQEQVLLLHQRQQQSHDPKLWKGLCHPLDLTAILPDANAPFSLKICAKEVVGKVETSKFKLGTPVSKMFEGDDGVMRPFSGTVKRYDSETLFYQIVYEDGDVEELTEKEVASILANNGAGGKEEGNLLHGSFAIHLAVCEYIEPCDLFDQLVGKMPKISLESSRKMARQYLEKNTVSIDIDCNGSNASSGSSLTFSLLCPISKMTIGTPVRGQHCKHMQCFDMKIWLQSNKNVSGGRWRCGVCEDFISMKELVWCGLFEAMLHDHRDKVSGSRDKVSFKPDGSWSLKEENKLRYSSKNRDIGNEGGEGAAVDDQVTVDTNAVSQKRSASQPEVIDLL